MATIPEIRERLTDMLEELDATAARLHKMVDALADEAYELSAKSEQLAEAVQELHRRPSIRKAPVESRRLTEEMKERIRIYKRANPKKTYKHIGNIFGVNTGRVSEAIRGKRT